jgi:hypothetical protein
MKHSLESAAHAQRPITGPRSLPTWQASQLRGFTFCRATLVPVPRREILTTPTTRWEASFQPTLEHKITCSHQQTLTLSSLMFASCFELCSAHSSPATQAWHPQRCTLAEHVLKHTSVQEAALQQPIGDNNMKSMAHLSATTLPLRRQARPRRSVSVARHHVSKFATRRNS